MGRVARQAHDFIHCHSMVDRLDYVLLDQTRKANNFDLNHQELRPSTTARQRDSARFSTTALEHSRIICASQADEEEKGRKRAITHQYNMVSVNIASGCCVVVSRSQLPNIGASEGSGPSTVEEPHEIRRLFHMLRRD